MPRQRLTAEQHNAISHLITVENWSDERVAKQVGCNPKTVQRFRRDVLKIEKGGAGIKIPPGFGGSQRTSRFSVSEVDLLAQQNADKVKTAFKISKRYKRLVNQLNGSDLEFFLEQWVDYHIQLEDMNVAEEDQLEIMITHKIRIDDNSREFKAVQDHEVFLKRLLKGRGEEELDLENENDRFIFELIQSNGNRKSAINRELKELTERYEKAQRAMNATREQREAKRKVGADTFLSLVRMFQEKEAREKAGMQNERIRVAAEAQADKMKKAHKFADNTMEPLLLDGSDYIDRKIDGENAVV